MPVLAPAPNADPPRAVRWRVVAATLCIGLALAGASPRAAAAQEALPATHWTCWYDQAQHIACLLDTSGAPDPQATQVAGRHPLPAVAELRTRPERWRGRLVRIPMHTEPLDETFTAELAQAVLCGAQPRCKADYSRQPVFSLQAMADLSDLNDDLLRSQD